MWFLGWQSQAGIFFLELQLVGSFVFFNLKKNFLCETERQSASVWRGRERRHRIQSRLQALRCKHRAWCMAWTHTQWDHDLSWSRIPNQLKHQAPPIFFLSLFILRETARVGEVQREGETENHKQAPCCVQSPTLARTRELQDHNLSRNQESDA